MKKLTINRQVEKKIHKGYKILEKIDFGQLPFDNEVVELVTGPLCWDRLPFRAKQGTWLGHLSEENHLGSGLLLSLIC